MNVMTCIPNEHPLMKAWEAHKQTDEYTNSKKWAAHEQHVNGSLWALFEAGWKAANKRIEDAPMATLSVANGNDLLITSAENANEWAGKTVRLVLEDEE